MSGNKLRVLALVHRHLVPPDKVDEGTDITNEPWRTEYDVVSTLTAMGHEVQVLPVHDDGRLVLVRQYRYAVDEASCRRVHMSNVHGYASVPFERA